jgi:hypothetical protein
MKNSAEKQIENEQLQISNILRGKLKQEYGNWGGLKPGCLPSPSKGFPCKRIISQTFKRRFAHRDYISSLQK